MSSSETITPKTTFHSPRLLREHMHHISVTIVSLTLAFLSIIGLFPENIWQIILLTIGVALIGVPHGALDHWYGWTLLNTRVGRWWPLIFFAGYGVVMSCVVVGWFGIPMFTLLLFLGLSALHFGYEDIQQRTLPILFQPFVALAVGSMVIWIPYFVHETRIQELFRWIAPGTLEDIVIPPTILFLVMGCVLLGYLANLGIDAVRHQSPDSMVEIFRIVSLGLLFATATPLLSFTVYFCAWHSIRGLIHLAKDMAPDNDFRGWKLLVQRSFPLTGLTLLLAACGSWFLWRTDTIAPNLIQIVFLGLSVIAIPHLLLHLVCEHVFEVNPFAQVRTTAGD
ncbi:MAG: Brp/Blh family beta-carotene 15,15'-dioxygenase [Gemmataceae bacterium]